MKNTPNITYLLISYYLKDIFSSIYESEKQAERKNYEQAENINIYTRVRRYFGEA